MAQSLAVRGRTSIEAVREALGALAERDRTGEVLTAIKHFPARKAAFAAMPYWVRPDLAAAYGAKHVEQLYTHQAAAADACGRAERGGGDADGLGQDALLQPAEF